MRAARIEAYMWLLLPILPRAQVCRAVDALLSRDDRLGWGET